ncbi:GntR family transcriptional regulator [Lichenihabitans sp. Uapishka_5]|uniref:GntR family transcriptional regulator n=1 Tax=Lichenihabitans sp. Uapishka_5 TaxID=3037302 RepID=UPI0029E815BA|nr:GntR family transcriptional regulator [Lichenihabitans sp. Uapishka_5]MDX7951921.1 GntR family transcriptional regulator [Lichenihabitans sp. Uapishka_5]
MTGPQRTTKAQDIYLALADDIAHGRLPPGTLLDEVGIATRFAVSRTPIREALRQLERCGLAESRPHKGAVVRRVSEQELDEMFAVMAELEGLCARWASRAMTTAERRALRALHAEGAACVQAGDRRAYVALNDAFHTALYQGSHNGYLAELAQDARRRVAPFRRAQFDELARLALSHAEHDRVLQAIERGDDARAQTEMRAHIGEVRSAVDGVYASHRSEQRHLMPTK